MADMTLNPVPPLSPEERSALLESIREHGVIVPVLRSAGPACEGEIVDGFHRTDVCEELGCECPAIYRDFATEAEFRIAQIETNMQRRQLTPVQKIELGMLLEPWEKILARERMSSGRGAGDSRDIVAAKIGISGASYTRGKAVLEQGTEELKQQLRSGNISINEAWRRLKNIVRLGQIGLTKEKIDTLEPPERGPYAAAVIDPPWPTEGVPYPTLTIEEIKALPISEIMLPDSTIWVWCLSTRMEWALEVLDHWGYRLATVLTWAKRSASPSGFLLGRTEHCLVGKKGKPVHNLGSETNLLELEDEAEGFYMGGKRREHSRKPQEFYDLVAKVTVGHKVDLYSRERRDGWASWGAEVEMFDDRQV